MAGSFPLVEAVGATCGRRTDTNLSGPGDTGDGQGGTSGLSGSGLDSHRAAGDPHRQRDPRSIETASPTWRRRCGRLGTDRVSDASRALLHEVSASAIVGGGEAVLEGDPDDNLRPPVVGVQFLERSMRVAQAGAAGVEDVHRLQTSSDRSQADGVGVEAG
jgi:hypothetical protein